MLPMYTNATISNRLEQKNIKRGTVDRHPSVDSMGRCYRCYNRIVPKFQYIDVICLRPGPDMGDIRSTDILYPSWTLYRGA